MGSEIAKKRLDWVDCGKGLTIALVVLHHSLGQDANSLFYSPNFLAFNDSLVLLRMPLFYLMAGIFARKAIFSSTADFATKKVLHFLYIFVLWSMILWAVTALAPYLITGTGYKKMARIVNMFVSPPQTLWFIYAMLWMFVITRVLRNLPDWLLLALAWSGYALFIGTGEHKKPEFYERVIRFYPFFLSGYLFSDALKGISEKIRVWHYAAIPLFFGLNHLIFTTDLVFIPAVVFVAHLMGVGSGILIADFISRHSFLDWIRTIGKYSLPIYCSHRLFVYLVERVVYGFDIHQPIPGILVSIALGVSGPILLSKLFDRLGWTGAFAVPASLSAWAYRVLSRNDETESARSPLPVGLPRAGSDRMRPEQLGSSSSRA